MEDGKSSAESMVLGLEMAPELMPVVALQVVWSLKLYGFSVSLYPPSKERMWAKNSVSYNSRKGWMETPCKALQAWPPVATC